jgi:hypothetical protein
VKDVICENHRLTVYKVAEGWNIHSVISCNFNRRFRDALGLSKIDAKTSLKNRKFNVFFLQKSPAISKSWNFFKKITTIDKTWVYGYDKTEWQSRSKVKTMLIAFLSLLQHCSLWVSSSGWRKWCNVAQEIILKQICVSRKSSSKLLLMDSRSFWINFINQNLPHFDIYLYHKYIFFLSTYRLLQLFL